MIIFKIENVIPRCALLLPLFFIAGCEESISYHKTYQHIGKTVVFNQPLLYLKDSFPGALDSNSKEVQYWLVRQDGDEAIPQIVLDRWDEMGPNKPIYIKLDANTKFTVDSSFTYRRYGWISFLLGDSFQYVVLRDDQGRVSDIREQNVPFK